MKVACIVLALLGLATAAAPSVQQFINDNHVLNYALTLENFESTLYAQVANFPQSAFDAAGYPNNTRSTVQYIGSIEAAHAALLTTVLKSRGWPAVQTCSSYNFTSVTTVQEFMAALAVVEAVGTSAYDGAASALTDKGLLTVAAGIATIEGRHTSLLNAVANSSQVGAFTPRLNSYDGSTPYNFTTVQGLIAPFFSTAKCPITTSYVPYINSNYAVQSTNASSYQWVYANTLRGLSSPFNYASNAAAGTNDLSILNYALTLENLEATYYNAFADLYNASAIEAAGVSAADASIISANIAVIAAHESTHVQFLTTQIKALGGTPATPCSYNIGTVGLTSSSTFVEFLAVAATLENTGVTAYVGAISYIVNSDLASVAAAIATVEGEHAAYISNLYANRNSLFVNNPYPQAGMPRGTGTPTGTAFNVADGLMDGPTPPVTIVNSINSLLNCTASQLGSPTITATQFLNYFSDQDAFNTNPGTTTTNTVTRNGAAAMVASVAVLAVAMLF